MTRIRCEIYGKACSDGCLHAGQLWDALNYRTCVTSLFPGPSPALSDPKNKQIMLIYALSMLQYYWRIMILNFISTVKSHLARQWFTYVLLCILAKKKFQTTRFHFDTFDECKFIIYFKILCISGFGDLCSPLLYWQYSQSATPFSHNCIHNKHWPLTLMLN